MRIKYKNKGFTLMELMAVTVILAIIVTIAVPNVSRVIEYAKERSYNVVVETIENSAQLYVANDRKAVQNEIKANGVYEVTVADLIRARLLKPGINDPRTNESISTDKKVLIMYDEEMYLIYCYEDNDCPEPYIRDWSTPVITLIGQKYIEVNIGDEYIDAGATAVDASNNDITNEINVNNLVDTNIVGTYTVTYTVSNSSGNQAVPVIRTVKVVDNIPPVITLNGNSTVTINVGSTYVDAGATAVDNADGNITAAIITTSMVNPNVLGTYIVTYNVTDSSGNQAEPVIRTVMVISTTKPTVVFNTNGNNTWAKNHSTNVMVTAAHGSIIQSSLYYLWTTNTNQPNESNINNSFTNGDTINSPSGVTGEYYLWIVAKDSYNNKTIVRSNVFKLDNTKPVITLNGSNLVTVYKGTNYSDAGATANDNIDGNITSLIILTGIVNTNVTGTYTVKYNVTDSSGNKANEVTRTVIVKGKYEDNTGAFRPYLASGMIPIRWDGSKWVKADLFEKWYDYNNKEWANAVLIKSGSKRTEYINGNPGKTIAEADVLAYLVWIPRYRYKLWNVGFGTPGMLMINITFETNINNRLSNSMNGQWLTHPAFKFGDEEIEGFWIGKFETTGTESAPTVKPGEPSVRELTASRLFGMNEKFNTGYGLDNAFDAHMLKNMEWGAVAYLSHSRYGRTDEIKINSNSSFCTGGSCSVTNYTNSTYIEQSTTGNVYGVYDMSGGAWEYVMGAMYKKGNSKINVQSSGFNNIDSTGMIKYIDKYNYGTSYNDQTAYNRSQLGDATGETRGWYGDYAEFVDSDYSWFLRGGHCYSSGNAGVFAFYSYDGYPNSIASGSRLGIS